MEGYGTDSFLARPRRKMFLVVFVARGMVMDIYFGSVLFPPFSMYASYLSLPSSCPWIVVGGLGVYFGMVGCLDLTVRLAKNHGLCLLVSLLLFILKSA